jgi:hypothetical protein
MRHSIAKVNELNAAKFDFEEFWSRNRNSHAYSGLNWVYWNKLYTPSPKHEFRQQENLVNQLLLWVQRGPDTRCL